MSSLIKQIITVEIVDQVFLLCIVHNVNPHKMAYVLIKKEINT